MASLLDIVNYALAEIGKPNVSNVNDSDAAIYIQAKVLQLYKEVLLDYNWNFAIVYVANYSPLTVNFSPDYVYSYALPGDYGKFFKWASTGAQWPIYAIWDAMMLANTLPIQYYYIKNDVPFEFWPPLVVRLLVLYVAAKSAPQLTNNVQLAQYLKAEYTEMRWKAIMENDQERSIQSTRYNEFNRITFV